MIFEDHTYHRACTVAVKPGVDEVRIMSASTTGAIIKMAPGDKWGAGWDDLLGRWVASRGVVNVFLPDAAFWAVFEEVAPE